MVFVQQELKAGDDTLAVNMANAARRGTIDPDSRCRLIEALTGARVVRNEDLILDLFRDLCTTENGDLHFSVVASATHLSRAGKASVKPLFEALARKCTPRVKKAIKAFLTQC